MFAGGGKEYLVWKHTLKFDIHCKTETGLVSLVDRVIFAIHLLNGSNLGESRTGMFDLPEWVILVTLFTELLSPITY
jgi:hypothetical protein